MGRLETDVFGARVVTPRNSLANRIIFSPEIIGLEFSTLSPSPPSSPCPLRPQSSPPLREILIFPTALIINSDRGEIVFRDTY